MKRIILSLILTLIMAGQSWAVLTATKIPVTKTGGSTPALQDSDITDASSTVTVAVPLVASSTITLGGVTESGWPAAGTNNWTQAGNNLTYTIGNIGIGSLTPGQQLDVTGTIRSVFVQANPYYIKFTNTQSSGTAAGNSTSGSWLLYPMNTKDNDDASIASLCTGNGSPVAACTASGQMVLPPGKYKVKAANNFPTVSSTFNGYVSLRIYNITGSAILVNGKSALLEPSSVIEGAAYTDVNGEFTLSVTSSVALQYQVSNSETGGLGLPASYGTEVYGTVEFEKIG